MLFVWTSPELFQFRFLFFRISGWMQPITINDLVWSKGTDSRFVEIKRQIRLGKWRPLLLFFLIVPRIRKIILSAYDSVFKASMPRELRKGLNSGNDPRLAEMQMRYFPSIVVNTSIQPDILNGLTLADIERIYVEMMMRIDRSDYTKAVLAGHKPKPLNSYPLIRDDSEFEVPDDYADRLIEGIKGYA